MKCAGPVAIWRCHLTRVGIIIMNIIIPERQPLYWDSVLVLTAPRKSFCFPKSVKHQGPVSIDNRLIFKIGMHILVRRYRYIKTTTGSNPFRAILSCWNSTKLSFLMMPSSVCSGIMQWCYCEGCLTRSIASCYLTPWINLCIFTYVCLESTGMKNIRLHNIRWHWFGYGGFVHMTLCNIYLNKSTPKLNLGLGK